MGRYFSALTEFWQPVSPTYQTWNNLLDNVRNHRQLHAGGIQIILHGGGVPCSTQPLQITSFASLTVLPSTNRSNSFGSMIMVHVMCSRCIYSVVGGPTNDNSKGMGINCAQFRTCRNRCLLATGRALQFVYFRVGEGDTLRGTFCK